MRRFLIGVSCLLAVGCGSSPKTHFYTLNTVPATVGHRQISFPVQLVAAQLPPSLDRRQMVRATGANTVKISASERWSAPLDEMVRNVLSQDLVTRLPKDKVILPEAPAPAGTGTIVVTIAQFGPVATGEVKLTGSWTLLKKGSNTAILQRDFHLRAGPAATADATAATMSRALGRLADAMVATLSNSNISISKRIDEPQNTPLPSPSPSLSPSPTPTRVRGQ
jgi:uncharacterized protein